MRIIMLSTRRGCADGYRVERYEQGVVYDCDDCTAPRYCAESLARFFIRSGWAHEVNAQGEPLTREDVERELQEWLEQSEKASRELLEKQERLRELLRPVFTNPATYEKKGTPL